MHGTHSPQEAGVGTGAVFTSTRATLGYIISSLKLATLDLFYTNSANEHFGLCLKSFSSAT